jgi:PERQ amino acid-rich with GYF domain-containing protein
VFLFPHTLTDCFPPPHAVEQFAATLLELPLEPAILSEAVYGYSETMDGNHFANEFVRRRKLADKGISEKEPASSASDGRNSTNGGWSEVAKKGSNNSNNNGGAAGKEDPGIPGFRIVQGKKGKGRK